MRIPNSFDVEAGDRAWHDVAKFLIECAVVSYQPEFNVRAAFEGAQNAELVDHFEWFQTEGRVVDTEAFGVSLERDVVLAFRGTEGLRDVLGDVTLSRSFLMDYEHKKPLADTKAHDGFRRCLDAVWSDRSNTRARATTKSATTIPEFLERHAGTDKKIWLTGHSLGGAIATLAAARLEGAGSPFKTRVGGLYTIGSPRALNGSGARKLMTQLGEDRVYRIVKSIDPVPLVPRIRYKHVSGTRSFVTSSGDLVLLREASPAQKSVARAKRRAESLLSWVRAVEGLIGSAIPGQHAGVDAWVAGHNAQAYLSAVKRWSPTNKHGLGDILKMTTSPIKLSVAGLASGGALDAYWPAIQLVLGL